MKRANSDEDEEEVTFIMHTAIIINNQFKYTSGFYRQSHQATSSDQTHYWSLISNLCFSLAPWVLAAGQIKTLTLTGFMDQIYTSINNDNHNSFFSAVIPSKTALVLQYCFSTACTASVLLVLHQNCLYCVRTACTASELQYCISRWDWHSWTFSFFFFVSNYWSEVNLITECGTRVCSDYSIINNRSQLIVPGLLFFFLVSDQ